MATDSSRLRAFRYFPNLPLEIRLEIWKLALSAPRVIGVTLLDEIHSPCKSEENRHRQEFWTTNVSSPQLLHVNHEACGVALTLYERVSVWYKNNAVWTRSYADYDKDVFNFCEAFHSKLFIDGNRIVQFEPNVPLALGRIRCLCIRSANVRTWNKWNGGAIIESSHRKRRAIQYLIAIFKAFTGLAELQLASGRPFNAQYKLVEPEGEMSYFDRNIHLMMLERIPGLVEEIAKEKSNLNIPSITMSSLVATRVLNGESSSLAHRFDVQD